MLKLVLLVFSTRAKSEIDVGFYGEVDQVDPFAFKLLGAKIVTSLFNNF